MQRTRHDQSFIEDLVRKVLDQQVPMTQLAKANGVHPGVLSKWVKKERLHREGVLRHDDVAEGNNAAVVNELEARVAMLEDRIETLRGLLERHFSDKYR